MKRHITLITGFFIVAFLIISCRKDSKPVSSSLTSINIVNASVNVSTMQVNPFDFPIIYSSYAGNVSYGTNKVFTVNPGSLTLNIVSSADTTKAIYNSTIIADPNGVYSLYLAGQSVAVDAFLIKDSIPYLSNITHGASDSVFGVRFINLSFNSNPVNITLSTSSTVNEFTNIAYKTGTSFKSYPAQIANTAYTFQVRDASTGNVIASYTFNTSGSTIIPRFMNCTLALIGQIGAIGSNAPKVIRVNNY